MNLLASSTSIFVIIIGAIFILAGLIGVISAILKNSRCTEQVMAKCKGYNEKISHSGNNGTTSITYVPVFEYQYNGYNYVKEYKGIVTDKKKYQQDQEVEIKINPNKPEEYVIGNSLKEIPFMLIFLCLGVLCIYLYFKK